jgi:hypothetical protein
MKIKFKKKRYTEDIPRLNLEDLKEKTAMEYAVEVRNRLGSLQKEEIKEYFEREPPPLRLEIEKAISGTASKKAPGPDIVL